MPRRTHRLVLLTLAIFGAFEFTSLLMPLGLAFLLFASYPCVLMAIPRLRQTRPPPWIIRTGFVLGAFGTAIWLTSSLIVVRVSRTPHTAWVFGNAHFSYEIFSTRNAPFFPNAPEMQLQWRPTALPIGCSYVGLGDFGGGNSREVACPTWPIAFCPLATALVLRALRRERIPPNHCTRCGYDLTGNVSGRCPECGTDVAQTAATAESSTTNRT